MTSFNAGAILGSGDRKEADWSAEANQRPTGPRKEEVRRLPEEVPQEQRNRN